MIRRTTLIKLLRVLILFLEVNMFDADKNKSVEIIIAMSSITIKNENLILYVSKTFSVCD